MSIFLDFPDDRILFRGAHFFIVYDGYPVSDGHCLIVSNKVRDTYFELSKEERNGLDSMIQKAKEIIEETRSPDGYNIGMNCGEDAGQTIFHAHIHLIPRRKGDSSKVRGGVRGCVPEKMDYEA